MTASITGPDGVALVDARLRGTFAPFEPWRLHVGHPVSAEQQAAGEMPARATIHELVVSRGGAR